jgi:glycosyltransferase involved in cell wall biosynthesis
MRILQLKTSAVRGGAETLVWEFTRGATARGHDVLTVFSEAGWLSDAFAEAGLPARMLPLSSAAGAARVPTLVRLIRKWRPDVVLCHGARVNLFGAMAARLAGTPSVSVEHNVDGWREAKPGLNRLDRICAGWNTHRIAVSRAVGAMLRERRIMPEGKVTVIPNAVDVGAGERLRVPREEARRRFGLAEDDFVLVTVARLSSQKGHVFLLDALRTLVPEFPNLRLLCLGDGELRAELAAKTHAAGLDAHVCFAGALPGVVGLLPAYDLFVLPSLWEGMPLALIEALAAGLPVLATAVAGTPEVVTSEHTGLLVPPGDAGALAEGIRRLLRDPDLRARLATAGQAHARREFHIDTMIDRYLAVLAHATEEVRHAA